MGFLSDVERASLTPSELVDKGTPIPTQVVSSDEYLPPRQNAAQREVEARLLDAGETSGHQPSAVFPDGGGHGGGVRGHEPGLRQCVRCL